MSTLSDNLKQPQSVTEQIVADHRVVPIDQAFLQHLSQAYWDWRTLFDNDPLAIPLQHPDFVLAELVNQQTSRSLQAVLILDEHPEEGKSIAILVPKAARTNQVGGLGPAWTMHGLRLAGGRFLSERESNSQQSRMVQAVTEHCSGVGASFLLIEDLDVAAPLSQAIRNKDVHGCRLFSARDNQPRRYVDLPDNEADYWKTFTSLSLRKHRAKVRKAGQHRLERVTEITQVPDFLRAAHEISRQSWQSHQFGMRIRDDDAELKEYSVLAEQGLLRCYVWWVEDQPAAFAVCNQHRGRLRYEETAFCSQYRNISAGSTMLHLIIEDLYRHNSPQTVDFGGGDAEYKQHFANRESNSGTVWLVPQTWHATCSLTYLNCCRRIRHQARRLVKWSGWGTKARQWIRLRGRTVGQPTETEETQEPASAGEPS